MNHSESSGAANEPLGEQRSSLLLEVDEPAAAGRHAAAGGPMGGMRGSPWISRGYFYADQTRWSETPWTQVSVCRSSPGAGNPERQRVFRQRSDDKSRWNEILGVRAIIKLPWIAYGFHTPDGSNVLSFAAVIQQSMPASISFPHAFRKQSIHFKETLWSALKVFPCFSPCAGQALSCPEGASRFLSPCSFSPHNCHKITWERVLALAALAVADEEGAVLVGRREEELLGFASADLAEVPAAGAEQRG